MFSIRFWSEQQIFAQFIVEIVLTCFGYRYGQKTETGMFEKSTTLSGGAFNLDFDRAFEVGYHYFVRSAVFDRFHILIDIGEIFIG